MKKIPIVIILLFVFTGVFLYSEISEIASVRTEKLSTVIRIKLSSVNIFLIKADEGYLLVDTAFTGSFDEFKRQLGHLNIKLPEIKYLFLTHHHDDHAGFAADFLKESGAKLIVHRKALGPLAKGRSEHTVVPANMCTKLVFEAFTSLKKKKNENFSYAPVKAGKNDYIVEDDNSGILKRIGIAGRILHTPGHTDDSLSIILDNGSTFIGDLAMNIMGFCGLQHRPIYAEDMNRVFMSWKKLYELGAKTVYTSHGEPFSSKELVPFFR